MLRAGDLNSNPPGKAAGGTAGGDRVIDRYFKPFCGSGLVKHLQADLRERVIRGLAATLGCRPPREAPSPVEKLG